MKSIPWLPYSASTRCDSFTASNYTDVCHDSRLTFVGSALTFSGTTPLKSTKAVVILRITRDEYNSLDKVKDTHM